MNNPYFMFCNRDDVVIEDYLDGTIKGKRVIMLGNRTDTIYLFSRINNYSPIIPFDIFIEFLNQMWVKIDANSYVFGYNYHNIGETDKKYYNLLLKRYFEDEFDEQEYIENNFGKGISNGKFVLKLNKMFNTNLNEGYLVRQIISDETGLYNIKYKDSLVNISTVLKVTHDIGVWYRGGHILMYVNNKGIYKYLYDALRKDNIKQFIYEVSRSYVLTDEPLRIIASTELLVNFIRGFTTFECVSFTKTSERIDAIFAIKNL